MCFGSGGTPGPEGVTETSGLAAGAGSSPFTMGASLLLPLAMKILPGLLGKKPKAPLPPNAGGANSDAGLAALAAPRPPEDMMNRFKADSFGGM